MSVPRKGKTAATMKGKAKRKRKATNIFLYTLYSAMNESIAHADQNSLHQSDFPEAIFFTQTMPQIKKSQHSKMVWNTSYELRESQEAWILISSQNLRDIFVSF